jgi:hypothetical protein
VGAHGDGSECAHKADIGVIVTLSSSEQSRFISYFVHHRSTGDQQRLCTKIAELRACKLGRFFWKPRLRFTAKSAGRTVGVKVIILHASTEPELEEAFSQAVQQRADALLVHIDALFNDHVEQIVALGCDVIRASRLTGSKRQAPRLHHVAGRRGSGVAARGARSFVRLFARKAWSRSEGLSLPLAST